MMHTKHLLLMFVLAATTVRAEAGFAQGCVAAHSNQHSMDELVISDDGRSGGLAEPGIEVFQRNDPAKVLAYRRFGASGEEVVVIVNLKNKAYTQYDIGVDDAGPWNVRLNTDSTTYGSDFADGQTGSIDATLADKDGKPYTLPLRLGAYGAMVLTR